MTLYSNSQSAIALAWNEQFHACTKHIDIRFHFIRYIIEASKITIDYCPTEDMVADTLTNALPSTKAKHFTAALGLCKVWGGVLEYRDAVGTATRDQHGRHVRPWMTWQGLIVDSPLFILLLCSLYPIVLYVHDSKAQST